MIPDAKLIFCPQYKVGTNEYMRLLRWLDGQDYNVFNPYNQSHSAGRNVFNLTELNAYSYEAALQMMFDSDWAKLVVVRDPLDRLRSAYFDKIRRRHKNPQQFATALNMPIPALWNLSFAAFVRRVDAQLKRKVVNIHWMPQAQACNLTRFKKYYQYVLPLGLDKSSHPMVRDCVLGIMRSRVSMSKLSALQHLVVADSIKGKLHKHQTNSSLEIFDEIYDKDTCKLALRIYAEDYDLFSLPRPTCHDTPPRVRWTV